jgi:membrane associated rhomboid family serine protease
MIPFSCDALLFHLPIATGGLIAINILTFAGFMSGSIDIENGWLLEYGTGLHPIQWLLSTFMHANFEHLLGNMFFLWSFGLITEGKLGWWRFLLVYLGIAVGQSAIEQAVMPHLTSDVPFTLGASAAIYGLMAMACVWTPVNELSIFVILGFRFFVFEMMVGMFAALYVGIDLAFTLFLGAGAAGSVAHLMGGAMGFAVGVVLLKLDKVECQDYDLLSVLSGTYGADKQKKREADAVVIKPHEQAARDNELRLEARRKFDAYLQIDQPEQALAVRARSSHLGRPLKLERQDLLRLISGLHKQKQWAASAPLMAELLEQYPENSEAVRLKLAQICLVELEKPNRAIELLEGLKGVQLPAAQDAMRRKIQAVAQKQIDEGVVEVDDQKW